MIYRLLDMLCTVLVSICEPFCCEGLPWDVPYQVIGCNSCCSFGSIQSNIPSRSQSHDLADMFRQHDQFDVVLDKSAQCWKCVFWLLNPTVMHCDCSEFCVEHHNSLSWLFYVSTFSCAFFLWSLGKAGKKFDSSFPSKHVGHDGADCSKDTKIAKTYEGKLVQVRLADWLNCPLVWLWVRIESYMCKIPFPNIMQTNAVLFKELLISPIGALQESQHFSMNFATEFCPGVFRPHTH